jgi:hypothetical protein
MTARNRGCELNKQEVTRASKNPSFPRRRESNHKKNFLRSKNKPQKHVE